MKAWCIGCLGPSQASGHLSKTNALVLNLRDGRIKKENNSPAYTVPFNELEEYDFRTGLHCSL
jgi:hypothetical protein